MVHETKSLNNNPAWGGPILRVSPLRETSTRICQDWACKVVPCDADKHGKSTAAVVLCILPQ